MKIFASLYLAILFLCACNKVKVSEPGDFNVTTAKTTYKITDTVSFSFTGNPDQITYYSGENSHNYAYNSRTFAKPDSTLLNFTTTTTASSTVTQSPALNNVSVLVSTDYDGTLNATNIQKATWTDISSKAKFATTTTAVASGNIHLDGLTSMSSQLYVAFRYVADTCTATSQSRKWAIPSIGIKSYFPDTTNVLVKDFSTGSFSNIYTILNNNNIWIYANNSLNFNAPVIGSSKDEDWAISRLINTSVISPDYGINIKTPSVLVNQYKYIFKKPGTYVVTFLAQNVTSDASAQVVRQLTLTISN